MIEAKELRIGNTVDLYGSKATICRSDFTPKTGGIAIESGRSMYITKKWIYRFGLNKPIGVHNSVFSGLISIKWSNTLGQYEMFIGTIQVRSLIYVHTLQNWWHANTGEEIKEDSE